MSSSIPRIATTAIALALCTAGSIASAQTAVEIEATASVEADMGTPSVRPLNDIRNRAQEMRQNLEARSQGSATQQNARASTSADMRIQVAQGSLEALARQQSGLIRERFQIAIRQLERIVARIESRIEKLQEAGAITTEAEVQLAAARARIDEARGDIENVTTYVENAPSGLSPQEMRSELRALIIEAQQSLRMAHKALIDTVRILSPLAARTQASTTITTE